MQAPFLGMGEGAPLESPARRIDRPQRSGPHPVVGYYRLALAVCVLFSHFGLFVGGYDQGQSAVIGFFLLSGYVMTLLLGKHYPKLWQAPGFYVDRLARISRLASTGGSRIRAISTRAAIARAVPS
jgi:hypothetical protein